MKLASDGGPDAEAGQLIAQHATGYENGGAGSTPVDHLPGDVSLYHASVGLISPACGYLDSKQKMRNFLPSFGTPSPGILRKRLRKRRNLLSSLSPHNCDISQDTVTSPPSTANKDSPIPKDCGNVEQSQEQHETKTEEDGKSLKQPVGTTLQDLQKTQVSVRLGKGKQDIQLELECMLRVDPNSTSMPSNFHHCHSELKGIGILAPSCPALLFADSDYPRGGKIATVQREVQLEVSSPNTAAAMAMMMLSPFS